MLYSIVEAARMLAISPWTLRKHISLGRVRVVRLGRRTLLDAAEAQRIAREGLPSLRAGVNWRATCNCNSTGSGNTNPTWNDEKEESCLEK